MKTILCLILSSLTCSGAIQVWRNGGVNVKSDPSLQFTNNITISAFAYYRRNYSGADLSPATIIGKQLANGSKTQFSFERGTSGTGSLNGEDFYYLSTGGVQFDQYADSTGQTPFATTNVWRHYAVTFAFGTGSSIRFYIDGAQYSGTWLAGNGNALTLTNAADCLIGDNGPLLYGWSGFITEVAIWNDTLNAAEVLVLAKSGVKGMPKQIRPSTLIGYWPLDQVPDNISDLTTNMFGNCSTITLSENRGTATGGCRGLAEHVLSYPPNE